MSYCPPIHVENLPEDLWSRNIKKRTFGHVHQAMIQISICFRIVESESSLGAIWIAKDAMFLQTDNEDFDQTTRIRRRI